MKKLLVALFAVVLATPAMAQNVGAIVASQTSSVAAAVVSDATSGAVQDAVQANAEPAQVDTQEK
ncbi:hypothetical protein [Magnetovibrio sp.]|uniref:hypothetical protein n=1 Tax=Magnetovibrio sp. TaxID=2024836 RepID=UPI002F91CD6B